jgi:hypothetical protein
MTSMKLLVHLIFSTLFISSLQLAVTVIVPEFCDDFEGTKPGKFYFINLSRGFECLPVPGGEIAYRLVRVFPET